MPLQLLCWCLYFSCFTLVTLLLKDGRCKVIEHKSCGELFMKQNIRFGLDRVYEYRAVFITTYLGCGYLVSSLTSTVQHNAVAVVDYNLTQCNDWLSCLTLASKETTIAVHLRAAINLMNYL